MNFEDRQKFLQAWPEHGSALARQATHEAHRLELQDRLADWGARDGKFSDELSLVDHIAGVEPTRVDPRQERIGEGFGLTCHA